MYDALTVRAKKISLYIGWFSVCQSFSSNETDVKIDENLLEEYVLNFGACKEYANIRVPKHAYVRVRTRTILEIVRVVRVPYASDSNRTRTVRVPYAYGTRQILEIWRVSFGKKTCNKSDAYGKKSDAYPREKTVRVQF